MNFTFDKESKLYLLLGLYVGALYAANLLGGKLMPIGFGDRGLSVSIVTFPFLFLITDIVGEVYGKKKAQQFVQIGLITLVVLLIWQIFSVSVPFASPNPWYEEIFNPAYPTIFELSITKLAELFIIVSPLKEPFIIKVTLSNVRLAPGLIVRF